MGLSTTVNTRQCQSSDVVLFFPYHAPNWSPGLVLSCSSVCLFRTCYIDVHYPVSLCHSSHDGRTNVEVKSESMGTIYGVHNVPGFVMNESILFYEVEQSDLPKPKYYCLHVDGVSRMKEWGLRLIREWNMPMEVRPVWVGDRKAMYAWVLPSNYTKKLLRDREFQARLVEFKEVARIPPDSRPRWLALRDGDMPSSYYGKPWAQEEYRSQSIQDTEMFLKSCANCNKSAPYVWEEGGEVDDFSEDDDEGDSSAPEDKDQDEDDGSDCEDGEMS